MSALPLADALSLEDRALTKKLGAYRKNEYLYT